MKTVRELKVYLASPWFTKEQAEREDRIKNKLRELGFNVWSPKENTMLLPDSNNELREKVFSNNINNIKDCDIIFVITDTKDIGTIWEAGFMCGYNENINDKKIIAYYCETLGPNGQFNLMLAQSGDYVFTDFSDLDNFPELLKKGENTSYAGLIE